MKKIYAVLPMILLISGCVTATGKRVNELETKTATLQAKVDSLEQRQSSLESQSGESRESVGYLKGKVESVPRGPSTVVVTGPSGSEGYVGGSSGKRVLTNKDIQVALKNAGFYKGPIDGKIGRMAKKAIKKFQKANGLKPDGLVGSKTRDLLTSYVLRETQ